MPATCLDPTGKSLPVQRNYVSEAEASAKAALADASGSDSQIVLAPLSDSRYHRMSREFGEATRDSPHGPLVLIGRRGRIADLHLPCPCANRRPAIFRRHIRFLSAAQTPAAAHRWR